MTLPAIDLAYDDHPGEGDGPVVVLLHAGIADRRMWRAQVPALQAGGHRTVTIDLPGYGDSPVPGDPFSHHDAVAALLDRLGIAPAVLVGCSFGGRVALDLALAHPHRVAALALFGSAVSGHRWSAETDQLWDQLTGDPDPDDLEAVAAAEVRFWVVGPHRDPADVQPDLLAFALELDRRALAAEARLDAAEVRQLDPPAVGRLAQITVPALVGAGAHDVGDLGALADRLATEMPRATRLPDVPNAAHLLPLEQPEPVNAALLAFLEHLPLDPPPDRP